jgi:hypothetical protein
MGYNAVESVESQPKFRMNMSPPSSVSKNKMSKEKTSVKPGGKHIAAIFRVEE